MRPRLTENHIIALNFLLIAGIAFVLALAVNDFVRWRLAWLDRGAVFLGPQLGAHMPRSRSRADYEMIVRRDVFNAARPVRGPVIAAPVNLHLRLLGTSQMSQSRPYAVIEDESSRRQSLYRLRDEIPGGGRLVLIEKNRVIVERNGQNVALEIPLNPAFAQSSSAAQPARRTKAPSAGVRRVAPNRWQLSRATVDRSMQNLGQLLMQARATPNLKGGKIEGFRLSEIQPDSLFGELGLQNGDIITQVNGQQINDPARAMQLLELLRNQQSISLDVIRNGQPTELDFDIH
jgi:general secretion pathway protein C